MRKTVPVIEAVGSFHLLDHSTTHNQLLYRAYDIDRKENTDILFVGVRFLELPTSLKDIRVRAATPEESAYVKGKFESETTLRCSVFVVEQAAFKYYVAADKVMTQTNAYEPLETSIPIKREPPMTTEEMLALVARTEEERQSHGDDWVFLES